MADRWCFQCGAAYTAEVAACVECGVELVDDRPASVDDLTASSRVQIAYELHEWSFEARRMVDQLLTGRNVAHAWQGATLLVNEADETTADAVVDEVDATQSPTLDPDAPRTVYEMEGWSAEHQTRLTDRLGLTGIPHQIDQGGDLVVHAADESEVDRLIDEVTAAIAAGDGEDRIELEGLGTNELLTAAFVAADRLRRDPNDRAAADDLVATAETMVRLRTPFGFDSRAWGSLTTRVTILVGHYEGDDPIGDDEARRLAEELRNELVRLI